MRTKKPHTFSWGRKNEKKTHSENSHHCIQPYYYFEPDIHECRKDTKTIVFSHSSRYIKYNISISDSGSEFLFPAHQSNV